MIGLASSIYITYSLKYRRYTNLATCLKPSTGYPKNSLELSLHSILFIFFTFFRFFFTLKGCVWDVIQSQNWFVRILHDQILAILLSHDEVQDTPDNTPGIVHVQVKLVSELDRLEVLGSQDHVPAAVLDVVPGHVAEPEGVSPGEDALDRPLGQLARVVFQLVGQAGSSLSVQFLSPVKVSSKSRVPFIECLQVDKLNLIIRTQLCSIQFTPADQSNVVAKIPSSVSISHTSNLTILIGVNEGVLHVKFILFTIGPQHLLAEVVVDEGGLQGQVPRTVEAGALLLGRLGGCLRNSQQIKLCVVTFVKENLSTNFLNNNVPTVNTPACTHES